jgi:putative ABC transport system ATP-binding protein
VALARALFARPQILLCDEPTGNLDAATGSEIVELLRALHRELGITVLAATHDEMLTGTGVQVLELSGGRLASRGRG